MTLPPSHDDPFRRDDDDASPAEAEEFRPELVEEPHRRLEIFKDNLEAFTIALVLALVIKHFCVEAFKIPTGSMMPTLYGEGRGPSQTGDRILVDKWAYLTHGPERGDVVVFRYPLNQSKHFIKRVAGVGPEWLKIVRGDLWVRASEDVPWRIATKRRRVRDELYLPVYPPAKTAIRAVEANDPADYWDTGPGWEVGGFGELAFDGEAPSKAVFLKAIGQDARDTYGGLRADGTLVRDARFRFALTPENSATVVVRWRPDDEEVLELRLAAADSKEGSYLSAVRPGVTAPLRRDFDFPSGRRVAVEMECADGEAYLHLDGEEVARIDLERRLDEERALEDFTQRFEIEAEGGAVRVTDFRADRDIHYRPDEMTELGRSGKGVWVPEGHYFMLGDNTTGSSDSRKWELLAIQFADGTEILYESHDRDNEPTLGEDGYRSVTDHEGILRRWKPHDETASGRRRRIRRSFVPRDLVVGRAFFVFWPLTPQFPGRAGFIH